MTSAFALRLQIESTLSRKIPSALTPTPKMMRPVAATGIAPLDDVLQGGLPENRLRGHGHIEENLKESSNGTGEKRVT